MTRLAVLALTLGAALLAGCADDGDPDGLGTRASEPQPTTLTAEGSPTTGSEEPSTSPDRPARPRITRTVARGLEVPWGVTFLPNGSALVGERDSGRVLSIAPSGRAREIGRVEQTAPRGEAGLLGLAASPSYAENRTVFAYVTTASDNRVVRFTVQGGRMGEVEPVLTDIPNGFIHDGGRLLFADDGTLLVSTGETGEPDLAQDVDSLGGKILRITTDGEPAPATRARAPRSGRWATATCRASPSTTTAGCGPPSSARTPGTSSTWCSRAATTAGRSTRAAARGRAARGTGDPHVTWRTSDASPSGLAYLDGSLWAGALRGERLWQVPVTEDGVGRPRGWFVGDLGRIRTVTATPEGTLWITTSNRDGRGAPAPDDDRIIEVTLR